MRNDGRRPDPGAVLRVVRGHPTDAELAALVVVVAALRGTPSPAGSGHVGGDWIAYWRQADRRP